MAPNQAPIRSGTPRENEANNEEGNSWKAKIVRLFTIWMIINFIYGRRYDIKNYLAPVFGYEVQPVYPGSGANLADKSSVIAEAQSGMISETQGENLALPESAARVGDLQWPQTVWPLVQSDQQFSIVIYINSVANISINDLLAGSASPYVVLSDISPSLIHAGQFSSINRHVEVELDDTVKYQNGSLYAHVLTRIAPVKPLDGQSSDPNDEIGHSVISITQYLPQRRVIKTKSLLKGEDNHDTDETSNEDEDIYETTDNNREIIVSHIHPNMTLQVVDTTASINYAATAPLIKSYMQLSNKVHPLDTTAGFYHPVIFHNEFWNLKKDYMPVKDLTKIGLNLAISTTSFLKFQMVATFSDGIRQQEMSGMVPASQFDEFKRVLMETNVYLLAVTVAVSLMHTLFEFLAFKNDISHWKQKKDNVGVSVRTIMANVIMQLIILLYLIDNNEETSYMILLSQGMGIVVEAWKITKSVDIQFSPPTDANLKAKKTKTTSLLNIIWITDKHELSDTEARTQEYDSIAFRYLYMIAIPLILAYAGYALVYLKHKSWYSFIISTLVGSVYAYGFLMLVPSIYINYRLKSVAHIPRKALVYKFLNTFIDDLFAWVVKMPLLHRLATLRDDVIFFVYLYQTWLYRVDYSRVNEFGQSGEDDKNEDVNLLETEPKKEI